MYGVWEEARFALTGELAAAGIGARPDPGSAESAALVAGSAREICLVRKLSGGGAVLVPGRPVEVGRRFELELPGGDRLAGTIAWVRGDEAGLAFDDLLDVLALVARNLANQPGDRRRLPRIEVRAAAGLGTPGGKVRGLVRDISQGGLKIALVRPLDPGTAVVIALPGFRPLDGEVRWWKDGLAGIAFGEELAWQELMPWLRTRQDEAFRAAALRPEPIPGVEAAPPPPAPALRNGDIQLNLAASVRTGRRRWTIEVREIDAHGIRFECFGRPDQGTLLWLKLPGLEGWPCRVDASDGDILSCTFLQPLHPAVLERMLAAARRP